MSWRHWVWATLALAALPAIQPAQTIGRIDDLAPGMFLVAPRELRDPNFRRSVVLLLQYERDGAMGLIVNRRTEIPLSGILRDFPPARESTAPVFIGGPVEQANLYVLTRSSTAPDQSRNAFSDVYLLSGRDPIQKAIAAGTDPRTFRAFAGYSGWGPGQLEGEVERGSWSLIRADVNSVFDRNPDTIWERLVERTEVRLARKLAPRYPMLQSSLH